MGSPKVNKGNDLNKVFGNTGSQVVNSDRTRLKATGDIKEEPVSPGFAKASPAFEPVEEVKAIASDAKAQEKAIKKHTKKLEKAQEITLDPTPPVGTTPITENVDAQDASDAS